MKRRGSLAGKRKLSNEPPISPSIVQNKRISAIGERALASQLGKNAANEFQARLGITVLVPNTKAIIDCLDDVVRTYIQVFIRWRHSSRYIVDIGQTVKRKRRNARSV